MTADVKRNSSWQVGIQAVLLLVAGIVWPAVPVNGAMDSSGLQEPSSAEEYFLRGKQREEAGDLLGAEMDYTRAFKIDPNYPNVINHRGIVRFRLGDVQGAVKDYSIGLKINSNDIYILTNRALCFYVMRNWIGVVNDLENKARLMPPGSNLDYDKLFGYLAKCHMGNVESAKEELKQYVANRHTDEPDDWFPHLADMLLGETSEKMLEQRAKIATGKTRKQRLCETYYYAAAKKALEGEMEQAIDLYRDCVETEVVEYGEHQLARLELGVLQLGVLLHAIPEEARAYLPLDEGVGLFVAEVYEGGPAQNAGIQKKDLLVAVDGKAANFDQLSKTWDEFKKGDTLKITVLRMAQEVELDVEVGIWDKQP